MGGILWPLGHFQSRRESASGDFSCVKEPDNPAAVLEAGAHGCVTIAPNMPDCRMVVTREVDGSGPGGVGRSLEAIETLISNSALFHRLAEAEHASARTQFGERVVVDHSMDVYREAMQ